MKTLPNNPINTVSNKRRSFVARLFTAGYGERSAVEVTIEKYEKTAMQYLKKQTQNN